MGIEIYDEEDAEHGEYMRLECLRIAANIKPHMEPTKMIETAMVFEWYVRGEIPPNESKELH